MKSTTINLSEYLKVGIGYIMGRKFDEIHINVKSLLEKYDKVYFEIDNDVYTVGVGFWQGLLHDSFHHYGLDLFKRIALKLTPENEFHRKRFDDYKRIVSRGA